MNDKFLVLTFSDNSRVKILCTAIVAMILHELLTDMENDLVSKYDLDISDARKQAKEELFKIPTVTDDQIIGYSQVMDWEKISPQVWWIDRPVTSCTLDYEQELLYCEKTIMTGQEVDRYQLQILSK